MEEVKNAFGRILKDGAVSAGKIGVLVSASCGEKQIEKITAFASALMPAFIASNSMGKPVPEKYADSVDTAARKNGKCAGVSALTIGVNDEILKRHGIGPLTAEQKARIETGEIETLFVFGDDIWELDTSKVKNAEQFKIEF